MKIFGIDITRAENVVSGKEEKGTTGRAKRFNKQTEKNQTLYRAVQDVSKWRKAVQEAENKTYPSRVNLFRLYQDVVLDAHLSAVMLQRKNSILCRNFKVYQNGEFSEEKTELLKTQWFLKIIEGILDANYYGFTLMDLGPFDNGFKDIITIERQYVKPEFGIVVYNTADINGIGIDDPNYKKWSLYFTKDSYFLGDLMKACPYVLYKKNAMGFWSEHTEKFGQPLRIGKTNTTDEAMVKNMEAQLRDMGSSFWAVMDTEDNIELITASGASHELYDKIIERCNSELSKLILGQTGTTDEKSFVGSAQVHKNILNDVLEYDDKWVTFNVNEKVLPILSLHGLDFTNCKFEFDYAETMTLKEKAEFDAKIMPFVQLDKEYLEDTYGIKLSEETPMEMGGEKKPLSTNLENITNSYNCSCTKCGGFKEVTNKIFFTKDEIDILVNDIWEGVYTVQNLPVWLYNQTSEYLFKNYLKGFKYPSVEIAQQSTDWNYLKEVRENIYYFSGAKTYHYVNETEKVLKEISQAMGRNLDSFEKFKEEATRISQTFNNSYLETEYNTARNVGRSSVEWARIDNVKDDLPLLTYLTTNDALVRDEHAELDLITRPVDDSFWNTFYPPNGWNCRCTAEQHDGEEYKVSDMKGFEYPELNEGFEVNFGKEKIAFSPDHAYFTVDKEHNNLALVNFNLPLPE